jgi:1-acyl-sn-glycerol-3-phosphate acyltransferase
VGKFRNLKQKRGWAWWIAVPIVKPVLLATTKQRWEGADNIPETGGCILALNHVSHIDPLTAAHITWDYGRQSRYLAKAGLFKNKWFAAFLRAAGQIPVERSTAGARAFDEAVKAVKSGAARIALATGAPVIPVGQWGAQELLPAYSTRPHPFPRKTVRMKVGEPVDLSDLLAQEPTTKVVAEATHRIMDAIVDLVADVRGEPRPAELFDPRKAGVRATGNPNKKPQK